MKGARVRYVCQECGAQAFQWAGRCDACGAWNTLSEVSGDHRAPAAANQAIALADVACETLVRFPTGLQELDRVLGGGVVPGSVVLIGGDPGIGKSTILIQALATMHAQVHGLYVTGEESAAQVAARAQRLGLDAPRLKLLAETNVDAIIACCRAEQPRVLVIDSIQTVFLPMLPSAPGSVSQVRESAARLVRFAKDTNTALFLVGHVTKEGQLAGPRVLEHMVDAVLYFEGDSGSRFRLIRAIKNRFGAVNELGVFVMTENGLREVANPSALFLRSGADTVSGSVVLATQEGTRPLLVEVQALIDESVGANPRRVALGLDGQRLGMLLALLHRHGGHATYRQDVFVNVAGGIRVGETAADLAVVLACASSLLDKPLGKDLVVFGEVGLAGEMRPVPRGQERLREAAKLGFRRAIVPSANLPKRGTDVGLRVTGINGVSEALRLIGEEP
ncbi:MAG: DNA repair protein RadA [Gammaproteobacteria bacterium]|nr:DNA repair protein RadA [Gammaproteobacteria bacterium]